MRLGSLRTAVLLLATALATVVGEMLIACADETRASVSSDPVLLSRISAVDPLNGGFLLVNMHGMLFHPDLNDIDEDLAYARWLGAGIVRVFGTDTNGSHQWDGNQVGSRIAEIAPMLRAHDLRLIVAFVNNHRGIPGDLPASSDWMDDYVQLLLPFYTTNWRGAYLQFVRDLITTVQSQNAQDVIYAWELGNELHTPREPEMLIPFITDAAEEVRALDPVTPLLAGTMGANHVEPGNPDSSIARWLYCQAPIDAYTLHAYDWVSRARPGDMPIDWDLDNIVSQPCSNGRALPVIVEELGTSRALPGVYTADDERGRLEQERRQIEFVRHFPQVVGFGVWNGESPRLVDRTFVDTRRGLTSYDPNAQGGGSCYDPTPETAPGARCSLEQLLRGSRFVRLDGSSQWTPSGDADTSAGGIRGAIDPVYQAESSNANALTISGWVLDPSATHAPGIDRLDLVLGSPPDGGIRLVGGQLGLVRTDVPMANSNPDFASAGFSVSLSLGDVPVGPTLFTLAAHSPDHGTWLSSLEVVVPTLGLVPAPRAVVRASPPPAQPPLKRPQGQVASPSPGDSEPRSFTLQVFVSGADRVEVFVDPDRDQGGRLVGSATRAHGQADDGLWSLNVSGVPLGRNTLYVHVESTATGQEQVLSLPIVIGS